MSQLLQPVFTQLWHSDPNVRLQSSVQLIGHLEAAQKAAVAPHASNATTDTEAEQEQLHSQLDDGLAPDVSYTLKRLIRGLASPRESSRIGFAVALTEVRLSLHETKISPQVASKAIGEYLLISRALYIRMTTALITHT